MYAFIHTHAYGIHVACMYIVYSDDDSDDAKDTESSDGSADEAQSHSEK